MEILLEGNMLTLLGADWKKDAPSIFNAIHQADVLVGIRVEGEAIKLKCYQGSEERLQEVAALLRGTFS